ncbi:hypothetical protein K439DRAFT_1107583 [Ramaria rubella]|nr:hypothetical protein K439DRAFT_1107583 [Ramaria rubella]
MQTLPRILEFKFWTGEVLTASAGNLSAIPLKKSVQGFEACMPNRAEFTSLIFIYLCFSFLRGLKSVCLKLRYYARRCDIIAMILSKPSTKVKCEWIFPALARRFGKARLSFRQCVGGKRPMFCDSLFAPCSDCHEYVDASFCHVNSQHSRRALYRDSDTVGWVRKIDMCLHVQVLPSVGGFSLYQVTILAV